MSTNLSAIIPVYNEEKNIPVLYKRLKIVFNKISKNHEIIFINDGSVDNSKKEIQKIIRRDKKVKFINFSRNFGHMSAVSAGLAHAKGNKVVLMDADLQDPPEVITKMIKKAKEGYDVVYGIKEKRKEGVVRRVLFKSFYKILDNISTYKMPLDSGTFSLMDKKVVAVLNTLPEKNKYLSGLRSWVGFSQIGITYERAARYSGKPMSIKKLTKLAIDGFVSFSYLPLRLASFLGFLTATVAFIFTVVVLVLKIFFGFGLIGWASTLSAILLLSGVQLITLGIIGEYLARIYDQVKSRPEYIISEKIGFKK